MLGKTLLLCGLTLSPTLARADGICLTTCRQIADKADLPQFKGFPFCITGVVSDACILLESHYLIIRDGTGSCYGNVHATNMPTSITRIFAGDFIRAVGHLDYPYASVAITNVTVFRHGPSPTLPFASGAEILSGKYDYAHIRTGGVIRNVFKDDTDADYSFVVLNCDDIPLYVAINTSCPGPVGHLQTGQQLELTARCLPNIASHRKHVGYILDATAIKVLSAPDGSSALPDILSIRRQGPIQISALGRHQATGRIVALWEHGLGLLQLSNDEFSRVEFNSADRPELGRRVHVIGYPATDLYSVNLTSADWTYASDKVPTADTNAVVEITANTWMQDKNGNPGISSHYHGQTVRLSGVVRDIPHEMERSGLVVLDSDGYDVLIDASANPDIVGGVQLGSTVRITGVCVRDVDNWRPNAPFPRIRRIFIVPRNARDVELISKPSFLTVKRLMTALCVALLALVVILIWNRILRAMVERRSRQLLRERMEGVRSKLKTDERTRIAVELHDSLSQNLAGVTFELDAARNLAHDKDLMMRHLGIASMALKSCRREMRDCLWDLRNNALGTGSLNEVIRRSLIPIAGQTLVVIRFDIPRSRLTDDMTHAILRITRELVSNAIRHGKATTVRISGCLDGRTIRFSVRDNGIGFGEAPPPGAAEGHFGLQGVRERVRRFQGEMTISRTPKDETRVAVSLKIPDFPD